MQTIDTVNPTILLAIELSASTWLVAARVPGSEKPHLHRIDGGDTAALLALISSLQARAARGLDAAISVVCCFEAGRDGFWLHRLLTAHGVVYHVLEPTSILVNRRARRAKTDRLDAEGMLRVLAASYLRGDHQARRPRDHILDQAGWHGAKDLNILSNLSLMPLPPRAPELNPQENIWQFMRQNWLSNRIFKSFDNIVDHCCYAWNTLIDQPWKIMSIARRDWAVVGQSTGLGSLHEAAASSGFCAVVLRLGPHRWFFSTSG